MKSICFEKLNVNLQWTSSLWNSNNKILKSSKTNSTLLSCIIHDLLIIPWLKYSYFHPPRISLAHPSWLNGLNHKCNGKVMIAHIFYTYWNNNQLNWQFSVNLSNLFTSIWYLLEPILINYLWKNHVFCTVKSLEHIVNNRRFSKVCILLGGWMLTIPNGSD